MARNYRGESEEAREKRLNNIYEQRLKRFNKDWEKEEAQCKRKELPEEVKIGLNQLISQVKAQRSKRSKIKPNILTEFEVYFTQTFKTNPESIKVTPGKLNEYSAISLTINYDKDTQQIKQKIDFHRNHALTSTIIRSFEESNIVLKDDLRRSDKLPITCRPTSEVILHNENAKVYFEQINSNTAARLFKLPIIENAVYVHQMTYNQSIIFIMSLDNY